MEQRNASVEKLIENGRRGSGNNEAEKRNENRWAVRLLRSKSNRQWKNQNEAIKNLCKLYEIDVIAMEDYED